LAFKRQIPAAQPRTDHLPARVVSISATALVAASWVSAAVFGLYILAFYLGAIPAGQLDTWNDGLPGLYEKRNLAALLAMATHMAMGAVMLLLGPVQLIAAVRRRLPALHRWLGRLYVSTAAIAGVGGLGFILSKGTIGGFWMNLGFGLYGALMILAATQTYRYARALRFDLHRIWAVRLFALAIGSWLYRMDFGFWLIAMNRLGHREDFRGPFDIVMSFFFYVPNLLVAEWFLRARRKSRHPAWQWSASALLMLATLVVAVGSYYFLRYYWGPGILDALAGKRA
jgi:hypothetical protein